MNGVLVFFLFFATSESVLQYLLMNISHERRIFYLIPEVCSNIFEEFIPIWNLKGFDEKESRRMESTNVRQIRFADASIRYECIVYLCYVCVHVKITLQCKLYWYLVMFFVYYFIQLPRSIGRFPLV